MLMNRCHEVRVFCFMWKRWNQNVAPLMMNASEKMVDSPSGRMFAMSVCRRLRPKSSSMMNPPMLIRRTRARRIKNSQRGFVFFMFLFGF